MLSAESKRKLEQVARDWCRENRADPDATAPDGKRPLWAWVVLEAINCAGWESSRDCPEENAPVLMLLIRKLGEVPSEFVSGGPNEDYPLKTERDDG